MEVVQDALASAKRRAALMGDSNKPKVVNTPPPPHRVTGKRALQKIPIHEVDPGSTSTAASSGTSLSSVERVTPDPKHLRVDSEAHMPSPRVLFVAGSGEPAVNDNSGLIKPCKKCIILFG